MMNRADDDKESQSATVVTGHHSEGRQIQFSPISTQPSGADNDDNEVDSGNANHETPKAAVEESVSVLQSQVPPPVLEESNEKHNHSRLNQSNCSGDAKA